MKREETAQRVYSQDETILLVTLYGAYLMNDLVTDYIVQARSLLSKTPSWKRQVKFHVNRAFECSRFQHLRSETQELRRQLFEYRDTDQPATFVDADGDEWHDVNFGDSTDRFASLVKLTIEDNLRNWYENEYIRQGVENPRAWSFLTTSYSLSRIASSVFDLRMAAMSHYPWSEVHRRGAIVYTDSSNIMQVLTRLLRPDGVRTHLHDALEAFLRTTHAHHDHEEHVRRTDNVIRMFTSESNILIASKIDYKRS